MSMAEVLQIAQPLRQALSVSHQQGGVHRNIKPTNVGLTQDSQVILADYGIAFSTRKIQHAIIMASLELLHISPQTSALKSHKIWKSIRHHESRQELLIKHGRLWL